MRPLAVLSLLVSLLLTACGSLTTGATGTATSGPSSSASLDFAAQTVPGEAFEGSSLAGKPTVLWFWAPWCPTCRSQIPAVSKLAHAHAGAVNVVGVGSLDDADALAGFAGRVGTDVVQLSDPEGVVWRHFAVTAQSTYLVLDANGHQVAKGSLSDAKLADMVDKLAG